MKSKLYINIGANTNMVANYNVTLILVQLECAHLRIKHKWLHTIECMY